MKYRILIFLLFLVPSVSAQQIADRVYWVYFTDKKDNGAQLEQPVDFLSQRSVNRRAWQGLGIDQSDEPVTKAYLDSLRAMGVEIRHVSRWLNGVAMVNASEELFRKVLEKPFTDTLAWSPDNPEVWFPPSPTGLRFEPPLTTPPNFDYGIASYQVEQVNMHVLHQEGYTGKGVWIGLLDAGFKNVDSLPAFTNMISEGRLLGTRNFIEDSPVFRMVNSHGMYVLSIIGAQVDGEMVGTAPHASFYLCATENVFQETRLEEVAWIEAAEYMDSLGFDVFNSSLGYHDFDSTLFDYRYQDLDGQSALISRAASMLASKGIILCNSAGNEGNDNWQHIIAPADASNIISVGAVDSEENIASFSSRGASYDGRVKPELVAMGRSTGIQYVDGSFSRGSGTSFSSPVMTGSVASLWQAYPGLSAKELIYRIRDTGNRFNNPDISYGFGIPNFAKAFWQISKIRDWERSMGLRIYPNPARGNLHIELPGSEPGVFSLNFYDLSGRRILTEVVQVPGDLTLKDHLGPGVYILELITSTSVYRTRLLKQ